MKHCPQCNVDYADTFEDCFQCGAALAEGAIAGEELNDEAQFKEQYNEDQEASSLLIMLKVGALAIFGFIGLLLIIGFLLSPRLWINERYFFIIHEIDGQGFLTQAGIVRDHHEARRLHQATGMDFPAPPAGKMIVYVPLASSQIVPQYEPYIASVRREKGGLTAVVGRSNKKMDVSLRLVGSVVDSVLAKAKKKRGGGGNKPVQYVLAAQVNDYAGELSVAIPPNLGIDTPFRSREVVDTFTENILSSWSTALITMALIGAFVFLYAFWKLFAS